MRAGLAQSAVLRIATARSQPPDHVRAAAGYPAPTPVAFRLGAGTSLRLLGWIGGVGPGNSAELPSRIPRSISCLKAGLPGGAVSRQLQLRPPNGFGAVSIEFGSAPAGAAPPM